MAGRRFSASSSSSSILCTPSPSVTSPARTYQVLRDDQYLSSENPLHPPRTRNQTSNHPFVMGLTFGTSLLDEVFKCFSINGVAINGTHESASGMDTVQQVDSSSLSDEHATKEVSAVCSGSPINVNDDDRADFLSTRLESRSRQNGLELKTTLPSSVPHSSPSRTHSFGSSNSSCRNTFSSTADTECSYRVSRPISRIADGDPAEDTSATPSLRSRWKRSTFGSLTRRSSSVSKVNGGAHSTGTLGRKGSEPPDSLNSNRRLTISRPILIGKPTILCQSPDPTISDPRSSASASCSTITSLNDHCSVSHESLGGLSATSRDSSLTMISSSNGYAQSNMEDENGLSDTVSYSSHAHVNGDEVRSIYSCSMSPAQSLCSINAIGRANGVSIDRGVRVLRGGDMVFRAATNTAGGGGGSTLNTRRRVGAPLISSGYTNEARSTTTRLRNPYVPLQNKHRSPDYLSAGLGSNQLLSRLDGLSVAGTTSAGPTTTARRTHEDLSTRMAGRRFSASSSSSSILCTPSPSVTSPARTYQDHVAGSTVRPQTAVTSTSGLTCNSSSNLGLLDGTIASFWGSTFADMLNDRRASSDREVMPTLTGCFESRAAAIKPSVTSLLPNLSGLTFGTSLLDEVFKCFSINGVAINGTHESASGMDTVQQVDSSSLSDEHATKEVSAVCSGSPINVNDDDRADFLSTRLESRSRQNGLELKTTLPSSVPHSSPSRTHSFGSSNSSCRNTFSSTADTECSYRVSRPISRIADGDPAEDTSATPSLRSRWKRSTFGSLTRRSSSVSKVNGGAHSTGTLGRKGSEPPDSLNSNRRLTISRPILIGKPTILCKMICATSKQVTAVYHPPR
ncbi:hypothetical protein AHF37_07564 [Paragonimus kellicotti]|nr:hypothetical protein AHF37_07564 [Paragonimus kellicotti]